MANNETIDSIKKDEQNNVEVKTTVVMTTTQIENQLKNAKDRLIQFEAQTAEQLARANAQIESQRNSLTNNIERLQAIVDGYTKKL